MRLWRSECIHLLPSLEACKQLFLEQLLRHANAAMPLYKQARARTDGTRAQHSTAQHSTCDVRRPLTCEEAHARGIYHTFAEGVGRRRGMACAHVCTAAGSRGGLGGSPGASLGLPIRRNVQHVRPLAMAATGDQLVVVSKALTRMLQCVLALHDTHALEFSPFMSEFLHHYVDMIIAYDPSQQARHATAPALRLVYV